MVNKLITGIAEAIRKEFPVVTYKIYTEKTEQGIQKPCFFILCVSQWHDAKLRDRFRLDASFDIHYFPQTGNAENWDTAETLQSLLEWITIDSNLIRGSSINYKIEDGILHFFIDYNLNMRHKGETYEYMEEVKVNGKISKTGR